MKDDETVILPIDVTHPAEIYLNQSTGELVMECVPYSRFDGKHRFRLIFEPQVLLEMMSAIPVIESNFRSLVEEKAKLNCVQ